MKKTALALLLLGLTGYAYAAELPFSEDFKSETTEFTFHDGNSDGNTFNHSKGNYNGYDYDNCVTFNGANAAADDWLITPSFELKAGYVYEVSYKSKVGYGCTFNTAWFVSSTPDAPFAGEAVSTFTESDTNYSWPDRTFRFSVEQDGTYCLGMHLTGEQGQGTYYFDNFSMSAGVSTATPAAPVATEAVISLADDKLIVKFDVTAPSVDVSGSDLSGDVTLKVTRSDNPELLFTQTAAPGAVWNFVDNDAAAALVTYSVVAVQGDLESEAAAVTANGTFVRPAAVKNFNVQHDGKGHFEFSWDAVTEGSGAGFFVPAEVRYSIMCGYKYIAQDIDGTTASYTHDLGSEPGQESVSFSIVATNSAGTSAATSSQDFLVGNPYTGEFAESFANRSYTTNTWTITEGSAWRISSSYYFPPTADPYDNDSGLLQASSSSKSTITSPIINMEGVVNPMLKFYMWRQNGYYYDPTLQVGFRYNGTDVTAGEPLHTKTDGVSGWEEVTIAVPEEVAAGDFQILFTYDNGSYSAVVLIDNITIKSYPDYSMSLEAVEAPEVAEIGQQIDIVARLSNMGIKAAEAYSVTFNIDGEEYATVSDVEAVAAMSEGSVVLPFTVAPKYAGTAITVEAVLNFDAEDFVDDNTASTTITVNENSLAKATDLDAAVNSDFTVTLTWTAPEVSDEPTVTVVTEDFESYEKGAIVGQNGWIFTGTDNESKRVLGGSNSIYDAMIVQSYTQSYGTSFAPNSGDNAVAFGQGYNYGAVVNSWIVSPEVAGNTPVSFYAICFYPYSTSYYTDQIQLLWSDGSTELDGFKLLETYTVVGTSWTEFSATLPAEAKRFAIHFEGKMSNDNIAIDDITYSAYGEPAVLTGINVYRNDELIATLPADATTYNDTTAPDNTTHSYYVTAVYDKGESMPSNTAKVDVPLGVDSVSAAGVTVYTEGSQLVVTGADGKTVAVADVAGRVVTTSAGDLRVTLTPGLYIVNVSGSTVKVVIR